MEPTINPRRYAFFHAIDGRPALVATVIWSGHDWNVTVDGRVLPDCCATIEDAFSVAEREIAQLFPDHACQQCRPWEAVTESD